MTVENEFSYFFKIVQLYIGTECLWADNVQEGFGDLAMLDNILTRDRVGVYFKKIRIWKSIKKSVKNDSASRIGDIQYDT